MNDPRRPWDDVADSVAELGRLVRERLAQADPRDRTAKDSAESADEQQQAGGRGADDPIEAANRALTALTDAAARISEKAGETLNDPELRASAQRVAQRLSSAVTETLGEAGAEVRTYLQARRNQREQSNAEVWETATDDVSGNGEAPPRSVDGQDPGESR